MHGIRLLCASSQISVLSYREEFAFLACFRKCVWSVRWRGGQHGYAELVEFADVPDTEANSVQDI